MISETERREEDELLRAFEEEKPRILGGIFAVLSKAISLKDGVKLSKKPRMADFAVWGYAIAEALGMRGERFLEEYSAVIREQAEEAIKGSMVGEVVLAFMERRDSWEGSASALLVELEQTATSLRVSTRAKAWPKMPNVLSRRLNELSSTLRSFGVIVEREHSGRRRISFTKTSSIPSEPSSPISPLQSTLTPNERSAAPHSG